MTTHQLLLVEDNLDYAGSLKDIIEDLMDHEVSIAPSGVDALRMAREGDYDLILLDINLPGMLGWDVAIALRKMESYRAKPIIAMTAYDDMETRKQVLRSGCTVYLTKPVDIDVLQELITMYLKGFN